MSKNIFTDRNSASYIDKTTKIFGYILIALIIIEVISMFIPQNF